MQKQAKQKAHKNPWNLFCVDWLLLGVRLIVEDSSWYTQWQTLHWRELIVSLLVSINCKELHCGHFFSVLNFFLVWTCVCNAHVITNSVNSHMYSPVVSGKHCFLGGVHYLQLLKFFSLLFYIDPKAFREEHWWRYAI